MKFRWNKSIYTGVQLHLQLFVPAFCFYFIIFRMDIFLGALKFGKYFNACYLRCDYCIPVNTGSELSGKKNLLHFGRKAPSRPWIKA